MKAEMSLLKGKQGDFWKGVKNAKANKADVLQYSPAVRTRLEATPSELMSQFTGDKGKITRALDRLKEWQAVPLEKMDAVTTIRGASGIFEAQKNHYLSEGFDLEKSKRLAGADVDDIITRTQSTRQYIGKSKLEAGALRYFVQLKQQPTKIFRGNIEAAKLLRQGRITTKQYASFVVWNNIVQGTAYTALRSIPTFLLAQAALNGYKAIGDQKAADEKQKQIDQNFSLNGLAGDAAFNSVTSATNAPIIGDMLTTLVQNTAFGKNYEYRPSLINTLVDDLMEAGKQAANGDYDEGVTSAIRMISRGAGIGDPVDAIKWIQNIQSAANNERRAEERKTPEAKRAASEKARLKAREKSGEKPAKKK
jgi:hypothetical protein